MKSKLMAALVAVLMVALLGGWIWQASRTRNEVVARLPQIPDLTGQPASLQERIQAADDRAISLSSPLDGFAELSRLYHANGFLDVAMTCYEGLAELQPENARWLHRHASILAGFGITDAALELWTRTIALEPDYLPARLRQADLLLKSNQLAAATRAYEAVLDQERDNAWAVLGLARIDLEEERWTAARPKLERVVTLTNYGLGYDLIVTLYERLGLESSAMAIRGRQSAFGSHRDPSDPWLDEIMEDCYDSFQLSLAAGTKLRVGEAATAQRWLERAIEVSPQDVSAHFQLAALLKQQNERQAALQYYIRCTQLDPLFSDGWAQLSDSYEKLGNRTEAERALTQGLEHCPDSPGLHRMRAKRLDAVGQSGAAVAGFRTAIRLRPNEPEPHIELGIILMKLGRSEEGIAQIENALVYDPLNPSALGILAFNAIESRQQTDADRWMERVVLQPRLGKNQITKLQQVYAQTFGHPWQPATP